MTQPFHPIIEQPAADRSLSIRLVTTGVLVLTGFLVLGSTLRPELAVGGAVLIIVSTLCYLLAPVSYSLEDGQLIVQSQLRRRSFGPVVSCSLLDPTRRWPFSIGLRLFGNGGLFAGSGIFWNRVFGLHYAYVTSARGSDLVLVETPDRKILISPADAGGFVAEFNGWRSDTSPAN